MNQRFDTPFEILSSIKPENISHSTYFQPKSFHSTMTSLPLPLPSSLPLLTSSLVLAHADAFNANQICERQIFHADFKCCLCIDQRKPHTVYTYSAMYTFNLIRYFTYLHSAGYRCRYGVRYIHLLRIEINNTFIIFKSIWLEIISFDFTITNSNASVQQRNQNGEWHRSQNQSK